MSDVVIKVDWSVFDKYPEDECECWCGAVFRSHAKCVSTSSGLILVARKVCPSCSHRESLRRISSDPETMTLGRDETK